MRGGRVHVVVENVPAGEYQIVQRGQGDEFLDLRGERVGALAQPDGAHLGQRSNRLGQAFAYGFDAGHEGSGDRAHAGDHDTQLSLGRLDLAAMLLRFGFRLRLCFCVLMTRRHV